jgi:hypothetical protein
MRNTHRVSTTLFLCSITATLIPTTACFGAYGPGAKPMTTPTRATTPGVDGSAGSPIIVSASEAPRPPGKAASGWSCYDFTSNNPNADRPIWQAPAESSSRSECHRKLDDCLEAAAKRARTEPSTENNNQSFQVGSCVSQAEVVCHYVWSSQLEGGGVHRCYRTKTQRTDALAVPTMAEKLSECAPHS